MTRSSMCIGIFVIAVVGTFVAMLTRTAWAHCEMPCGIYDDPLRIQMMREEAVTINKAMDELSQLMEPGSDKSPALLMNQAARWVTVKEDAAQKIQDTISSYFLTQRVKAVEEGQAGYESYMTQLKLNHAVLVASMKCKQTVDSKNAAALLAAIEKLTPYYTTVYPALKADGGGHDAQHSHDHDHDHSHDHDHDHDH